MTRAAALAAFDRRFAAVLEIDVDRCTRTYGVAPCTAAGAAGSECYNTAATCQDRANFVAAPLTLQFCSRGMAAPAGETLRPYLLEAKAVPTEIDPRKGLAMRGQTQATLTDEPCPDTLDPYAATRATPAAGTFWQRFAARNRHIAGRPARIRRGYVTTPFDWATFQTETYEIERFAGPDSQGRVTLVLADAVKALDRVKLPAASDGKLAADFDAYAHVGRAVAGGASSITLPADASAADDTYNGQEILLTANTGAGQRRTISDYVGATRVATVGAAWSVTPDSTSEYEISPLSLTVATGKGAQYNDPATTGRREYIRVKDEVIEYTSRSGDMLSWPSSAYRAQFGTTRPYPDAARAGGTQQAARSGDLVQQAHAWTAAAPATVIEDMLNAAGIADANIDLTGLAQTCEDWLALRSEITACVAAPEAISTLLAELLRDLGLMVWWDAVAAKVRFRADRPQISDTVADRTDDAWVRDSMQVERADDLRITSAALYYAITSATADRAKPEQYLRAEVVIDTDAESAAEYGDERPDLRLSRWLTADNELQARAQTRRRLLALRDAPGRYTARLDPRDEVSPGDLIDVVCAQVTDVTGNPATVRCRVVRVIDEGTHQEVRLESTRYAEPYIDAAGVARVRRTAFIAPAGQPNYTSASAAQQQYAYIAAAATGAMSDGGDPYLIA